MNTVRAIIVDDEPLGRERIRMLLAEHQNIEIVDECSDGRMAVESIRRLKPDLVFLDIQMPELSGFDVLERIAPEKMPAIIFVTAFDAYAIRAFDVNALDYLLKPVDPERLARAVTRIEQHATEQDLSQRLLMLLENVSRPKYRTRLVVQDAHGAFFLPVDSVAWLEAAGNYVRIHSQDKEYLIRETMKDLEQTLDPEKFARVNRSAVVQMDQIARIEPWARGEYAIILRDGARLISSRTYGAAFRKFVE